MTDQAPDIKNMYQMMAEFRGEIRLQPWRYGPGLVVCGCSTIEWAFDDEWLGLVESAVQETESSKFFSLHPLISIIREPDETKAVEAFARCEAELVQFTKILERK